MLQSIPEPKKKSVDYLLIAGEHSGDQHAAELVKDLYQKNPNLNICALGGPALSEAGADVLVDMMGYAVVGFVEVLKHYKDFKNLFERVVEWIKIHQPKAICFVDYPGFNLRLAERLYKEGLSQKVGGPIKLYYYIAPQVWAWKPKRRFKMAKYLDSLGVIFPFEVETFADTDLPTTFVGHPFVRKGHQLPVVYEANNQILLLPGSRTAAVGRIFPVMLNAFGALHALRPEVRATVVYPSELVRELLEKILEDFPTLKSAICFQSHDTPAKGAAVLTSSGTMSLACALAGVPGAIVYRAHPLTYLMGRMIVKIPFLGIANILMGYEAVPEYIQGDAIPPILLHELDRALHVPECVAQAQKLAEELSILLQPKAAVPGAAPWIIDY